MESMRDVLRDALLRDLRAAVRSLTRSRITTAVTIVTLAVGIGANAAMFGIVDAVLLHPVPTREIDRLVMLYDEIPRLNMTRARMPAGEILDLAEEREVFQRIGAFSATARDWLGATETTRLSIATTLGDYFGVFEVQ